MFENLLQALFLRSGMGSLEIRTPGPDILIASRTYTAGQEGARGQYLAAQPLEDGAFIIDSGYSPFFPRRLFPVANRTALIASRTYSAEDGKGTLGQVVPALGDRHTIGLGEGRLTALAVSRSPSEVTQVGWTNPGRDAGTVALRLISAAGELLAEATYDLEAQRSSLIPDVFAALAVEPQKNCRVELEVVAGAARILGYAVLTDLVSSDPIHIPARRIPGPIPEALIVQHHASENHPSEVILVDQLAGAAGFAALAEGTFTATLAGSGDLGRADLATHAVCLYVDPEGLLHSAALEFGDTINGIGGGFPFWCFIPDWITCDDNTGWAEIVLTGGGETLTLDLDPADDCVLLDRLPESELVLRPAGSYLVESSGHYGGSNIVMKPQVLVMHKHAVTGELVVTTVVDGALIPDVADWAPLLVVGLDWITTEHNAGFTWLRPGG